MVDGSAALALDVAGVPGMLPELGRELSSTEKEAVRRLLELARAIGADVLRAPTVDDVEDGIDHALEDPRFAPLRARVAELTPRLIREHSPLMFQRADYTGRVDERTAELLNAADELLEVQMEALAQLQPPADADVRAAEEHAEARDPLWFLTIGLPAELSSTLLAKRRALVATLALQLAFAERGWIEPWRARHLALVRLQGEHAGARLVASMPGSTVPEDVVPRSERLDLNAMEQRHREFVHRIKTMHGEALRAGTAVYPNGPELGDEP